MGISLLKAIAQTLNSVNPSGKANIILDGPAGRLILPVVPAELPKVGNSQNNETFSSVLGDLFTYHRNAGTPDGDTGNHRTDLCRKIFLV